MRKSNMTIFKLAHRNLLENKKKNRIIFIGLLLTCTLLFSLGIGVSAYIEYNRTKTINREGFYHVAFLGDYNILSRLEENKEIDNIFVAQLKDNFQLEITDEEKRYYDDIDSITLNIIGSSINESGIISLSTGHFPTKNNEIIISHSLSQRLNLTIGSVYENYRVVGIYEQSKILTENRSTYYAYTYENSKETKKETIFYITFKSLNNAYNRIYDFADSLGYQYEITEWGERKYDDMSINDTLLAAYGESWDTKEKNSDVYLLIIILSILSLFCISIVYNSVMISVIERKSFFGMLRSVGATKIQIFQLVLIETLLLALISIPLAFIISIILVKIVIYILNIILASILTSKITLIFRWSYVLISLVFIILTSIISATIPAWKASLISPMEAIRNGKKIKINKTKENYPLIKAYFGNLGEYAYKNIKRQKSKFRTTIFSLSCCIILFVSLSAYFRTNLKEYIDPFFYKFDAEMQIPDEENAKAIINELEQLKNYDEFVYYKNTLVSANYIGNESQEYKDYLVRRRKTNEKAYGQNHRESKFDALSIYGLDNKTFQKYQSKMHVEGIDYLFFNNGIYNMTKKDLPNTKVYRFTNSDYKIELYTLKNKWTDEEYGIKYYDIDNFKQMDKKFYLNPSGATMVVNLDTYEAIYNDMLTANSEEKKLINVYYIGFNAKNIDELDKEIVSVINKYSNIEIFYYPNKIKYREEHLNNIAVYFVVYTIILFIALISIINSFNVISANMKVRESEFACLRSIGLDEEGLQKITKLENLFLHAHTLFYGLTGSFIVLYLEQLLGGTLYARDFAFPLIEIIISIIVIQIVIVRITKYCNNKIKSQNIIETIRKASL